MQDIKMESHAAVKVILAFYNSMQKYFDCIITVKNEIY